MNTRVTSPRLIGRRNELEWLEAAFKLAAAEERASTILIAGEAGVGKSRLVAEFAARVSDAGGVVAVGSCLELVDRTMPFGPVVQALREVFAPMDAPARRTIVAGAQGALGSLLPELRVDGGVLGGDEGAALFEQLLGVLTRLGDRAPTVIVLEDLHWADHSTRDLLLFLARNLRDARVVVVGTYRSDDLHRRHPLRGLLAELERSGVAPRLDLERLDRDEVIELVAAIRGVAPDAALVDRTYDRSDGNAFFAEELLAAEDCCGVDALPESLRDILLARIDALTDASQRVLRVVAVIGREADHRLLRELSDLDDAELDAGLRDAVGHQVLLTEPDGLAYRFRHALVHEAVYEDLLPGERVRLHAGVAALLSEHPEWLDTGPSTLAGELACHWYAAHDVPRALVAAVDAARHAEQMHAYPEALVHVERALELWPQVADAEAGAGMGHVSLLRYAAHQAELGGNIERALQFVRQASVEVDEAVDPDAAGLVQERIGRYLWMLQRDTDDAIAHVRNGVELVPAEPPTEARAQVLATLGQQLMISGANREAVAVCEEAIAVALAVGAPAIEGHARNSLGSALANLGMLEAGLYELGRARELATANQAWGDLARAAVNEGAMLDAAGRHEDAVTRSVSGAQDAREHGLDRLLGTWLRLGAASSLWELGRWDEMEEQLREADAVDLMSIDVVRWHEEWALLLAGRGSYDDARARVAHGWAAMGTAFKDERAQSLALVEARVNLWSGDTPAAVDFVLGIVDEPLPDVTACSDVGPRLLAVAGAATSDGAVLAGLRTRLDEWIATRRWDGGEPADVVPIVAQLAAEEHRDDAEAWRAVAEQWEVGSRLPHVAYARAREAEAHLARSHDTDAAAAAARIAYDLAQNMGFAWLRDNVAALARRGHLDLGTELARPSAPSALSLTPRELEVLRLVAEGRTNRQIAEYLFISTKTASVHVSNILTKLHVTNRGEAAAAARRLGLDR